MSATINVPGAVKIETTVVAGGSTYADLGYPRLFQRADGKVVCIYYWSSESGPEAGIEATIWKP